MIGLDTNVIIRYLMQDDKKQFSRAENLVESAIKQKNSLHICLIVLCEIVWVLNYHYELKKDEITNFLGLLLHAEHVEVENRELVLNAFKEYQNCQADFSATAHKVEVNAAFHNTNMAEDGVSGIQKMFTPQLYEQLHFSDCLIGKANQFYGCSTTYTFDKKTVKLTSFTQV